MSSVGYLVPVGVHRVEDVVRRSRFVTTLARAPSSEAARGFVERVRAELPDATHHCHAFVAGPPGSTAYVGLSDAGEPHGTAGRPMLSVLLHSGIGEIVAVSSRWFGGTKLGTGGLARAYAAGVTVALETLPTERWVPRERLDVQVAYAHLAALRRLAQDLDADVEDEVFEGEVRCVVVVPAYRMEAFAARLADATAGTAVVRGPGSEPATGEGRTDSDP